MLDSLGAGFLGFVMVSALLFPLQVWLWPRSQWLGLEREDRTLPPPELVVCQTCGRKRVVGGSHPINHCSGPGINDPQFSARRRRW